jgi:Putative peptidoglycan binding domain
MRTAVVVVCVSLGLILPQLSQGNDKKRGGGAGGGGGKAARAVGGGGGHGGGGGRGAHFGAGGGGAGAAHGMGAHHTGGGGQSAGRSNFQGGGQAGHGGHGLNAHHAGGLNAQHQGGGGLNAQHRAGAGGINGGAKGFGGRRTGNNFARQGVNRQFGAHNRFAGRGAHWREGTHWRDSHTVIYNYRTRGRVYHDYGWWGSHYDVVVVGGGWGPWYWDGGYWFPAWGYAPDFVYSCGACDAPVYAYANLPPDQVVVNVQEALQDQGYYTGQIDGILGQKTIDAVLQYQREHNLEQTAAIDESTVASLGLITQDEQA